MKKIVIQVHMENDKCRSKALKIAAAFQGVHSLSLEGESRDEMVVTGNGIDSVCLTNKLRKKFRYVTLVSVADANDEDRKGSEEEHLEERVDANCMENLAETYRYANNPQPSCPPYHLIFNEGGDVSEEEQVYCTENLAETYRYANNPQPSCPPYHLIFNEGGDVSEEEQVYCTENLAETYSYANIPQPSCSPYYVIYDPYPNSCPIL